MTNLEQEWCFAEFECLEIGEDVFLEEPRSGKAVNAP